MEIAEYAAHDATGLAELIAAGKVSEAEVSEAARRAIAAVNGQLNAVVSGPFDEPLAHDPAGPFGGVPFAIKDLVPAVIGQGSMSLPSLVNVVT